MGKFLFLSFIILLSASQIFSQNNQRKIAGAYQWCPFECETFKLNDDFTFDYIIDGDLFYNRRTKGVWKFVGKNRIHLKSLNKKLVAKVTEKQNAIRDKILIRVRDFTSAAIPGVTIKFNFQGQERQYITDDDGNSEIPITDQVKLESSLFSEKYKIIYPQTNELTFEFNLTNKPSASVDSIFVVDVYFIFIKGRLYKILEDASIFQNSYKKLSKKTTRKLFPEK